MNVNIIRVMAKLNISYFWRSVYFSTVGFCEEFMSRKYLQTRLISYIGKNKGWITTSIFI